MFFRKENGEIRGLIFLEDNGRLLEHDLIREVTHGRGLLEVRGGSEN